MKFLQAIKKGELGEVEEWIRRVEASDGADISSFVDTRNKTYIVGDSEISSRGMTALHYAAFYCQHKIVEKLMDADAGMLHYMTNGSTPLYLKRCGLINVIIVWILPLELASYGPAVYS